MRAGQFLLDKYVAQARQWCWRTEWYVQGESMWSLLWKFAHLNQITARETVQLVINRTCGKRTSICAKPDVDLRDSAVFDLAVLSDIFRVPAGQVASAFLYETLPGSVLRSSEQLRWCPPCMARGFHSPLFQMKLTRQCPIHERALIERCPGCKRPIPYRLTTAYLSKPFHCPHCELDLAPNMRNERPVILRMRQSERSRLSLLRVFHRLADVELVSAVDLEKLIATARDRGVALVKRDDLDIESHYAGFISQVVQDTSSKYHRHQPGLRLEKIDKHLCHCRNRGFAHHDDLEEARDRFLAIRPSPSDLCLDSLVDTYKAVRRRVWRRVLKNHQHCITSAAAKLWWNLDGDSVFHFCPHAMAFIRWRMLWEGCGTPRYLFAPSRKTLIGIIGWHLARPAPAPDDWAKETKGWISRHIFAATCIASLDQMVRWAQAASSETTICWDRPKSAVSHCCLWAISGQDTPEMPAVVYVRRSPVVQLCGPAVAVLPGHRTMHLAQIARLVR